ncbi:MAG TPA: SCO family protein [Acidimicrobiales bacterium]|nr:SCO family protein [Acidimicrobiales bacterium]
MVSRLPLVLTVLLVLSACGRAAATSESTWAGVELAQPMAKPQLVLTDTDGNPYDLVERTAGRTTLVYFGYTSCTDICPIHLAQLSQVMSRNDMPRDVTVILITVDPERDTPEVLRRYLDSFDPEFVGLTGTVAEVEEAQRMFGLPVARPELDDPGVYGHAGQVFAFAPDGLARTVYPYGTRQTQWVHDLPLLADIPAAPSPALETNP